MITVSTYWIKQIVYFGNFQLKILLYQNLDHSTCKLNNVPFHVVLLCRLPALAEATYRDHYPSSGVVVVVGVTKKFCHIFLRNHRGQLPDIWHRASVWRTVSCNAFLNLRHVHFLFDATLNIVDIGKFAHKIISVTFFSGTTEASFLIFGTEHQYGELYRVTQFWICGMFWHVFPGRLTTKFHYVFQIF